MSKAQIITKESISLAELKDSLEKIQKRDEEVGFRAGKAIEYINSVSVLTKKEYEELKQKIMALEVPRLKEEHINKIIDFMPKSKDDLEVIIQGYPITVSKESMEKIVSEILSFGK